MKPKYLFFAIAAVLTLALDQATKIWARTVLRPHGPIRVVRGYFDLVYTENRGSAFSVVRDFGEARYLFFALGIVVLAMVLLWLAKLPDGAVGMAAKLGVLLGGALGNLVDRVQYGVVTDFILWKVERPEGTYAWPVFNIADAALVVGVLLMLFSRTRPREPEKVPIKNL